jgi:hypothetical protein
MYRTSFTALALILFLSASVAAQTKIYEAEGESLFACQWVHEPATCDERHIWWETPPSIGGIVELSGERHIIEWMGPGYHFESGLILQSVGLAKPGLRGQRWLEIYPVQGRVHTSRVWKDVDGNLALSPSDTLMFRTGAPLGVTDVRLQLRVRPAPVEP